MKEDELDRRLTFSSKMGESAGWKAASAWILGIASENFVRGCDENARTLRSLATRAKETAERLATEAEAFR